MSSQTSYLGTFRDFFAVFDFTTKASGDAHCCQQLEKTVPSRKKNDGEMDAGFQVKDAWPIDRFFPTQTRVYIRHSTKRSCDDV